MKGTMQSQQSRPSAMPAGYIGLHCDDQRSVHVTAPGNDVFFLTALEATLGCNMAAKVMSQVREFPEKIEAAARKVAVWSHERPQIDRAVAGMNENQWVVVLVAVDGKACMAVEEQVSDLDLDLHDMLPFPVNVICIPRSHAQSLAPYICGGVQSIYARTGGTQSQG